MMTFFFSQNKLITLLLFSKYHFINNKIKLYKQSYIHAHIISDNSLI